MSIEFETNLAMEAAAQRLASELQTSPAAAAAAANELRNELYTGNLPESSAQALANEANRLAGPYSSHLMIRPIADGRLDVQVIPPNSNYGAAAPPYYPAPYYPAPYYSSPPVYGIGVPGIGNIGLGGISSIRVNLQPNGFHWRRW